MNKNELIDKIKNKKINEINPFVINDGGNIIFIDFKKGIIYIEVDGTC